MIFAKMDKQPLLAVLLTTCLPKGHGTRPVSLKTLQTEKSAHNGNAQNNAAKNITQRCKKTVEDEPAKVADKIYASIRLKY